MPAFGRYPVADAQDPGLEISSGNEGRVIGVTESDIVHPSHTDGFVDIGDPVVIGANIVGVALIDAAVATDVISVDTEGIFNLDVVASNDDGNSAVAGGDLIYINKTDGVLSKISNTVTNIPFGYALGIVGAGLTEAIAVKVHFDPTTPMVKIGTSSANYTSGVAGRLFREYRYKSTGTSGDIRGLYMALSLAGINPTGGEAIRARTIVDAAIGNAHGLHGGIEFGDDGSVSGLGVGVRATYMGKNAAAAASIAGGMSELFAVGASTDYSTATEHSIHRFVNDGNATGKATADNVFAFSGLTTNQFEANTDTPAFGLRCIVDGVPYWIMMSEAQS